MQEAPTVEPIPLGRLRPWTAAAAVLVLLAYVTAFVEEGAAGPAGAVLHELLHDGRHLLGVPCH